MRLNSRMRRLLDQGDGFDPHGPLPPDCERLLGEGWRIGNSGVLLLAASGDLLARQRMITADEVGEFEYEHNDFSIPDEDLASAVPAFAPRLSSGTWTEDDPAIDYRGPDGQFPVDVAAFLSRMAARGLTFASRAVRLAAQQGLDAAGALVAIINIGVTGDVLVHGTHVHITTARGAPSKWFDLSWFDDLERFEMDAMAVIDLHEASLESLAS